MHVILNKASFFLSICLYVGKLVCLSLSVSLTLSISHTHTYAHTHTHTSIMTRPIVRLLCLSLVKRKVVISRICLGNLRLNKSFKFSHFRQKKFPKLKLRVIINLRDPWGVWAVKTILLPNQINYFYLYAVLLIVDDSLTEPF